MDNKRGSNVDVIISFMIFIGFIVFFYVLIQPALSSSHPDKSVFLNSLDAELVENLTGTNFTIISFTINETKSPKSCIELKNFFNLTGVNSTIVILNGTGSFFPSYQDPPSQDLYINTSSALSYNFFYAYYSTSFSAIPPNTLSSCTPLNEGQSSNFYELGQVQNLSSDYIFDLNVKQLISSYDSNYGSVKAWFNITANEDFGFNFTYQNMTSIGTNDKPPAYSQVYSESFPVLYITSNNSVQSGNLIIRIW